MWASCSPGGRSLPAWPRGLLWWPFRSLVPLAGKTPQRLPFPYISGLFSFSRVVAMCTMPRATQPHTCATGYAGEGLPRANPSMGGVVSRDAVLSSPTWAGVVLGKPQTTRNELGKGLGLRQPGVSSLPHCILALTLCRLPDPSESHGCNFLTVPPHRVVEGTIWEAYKVCTYGHKRDPFSFPSGIPQSTKQELLSPLVTSLADILLAL